MSALSLNSSHVGSLPLPSQQVWLRQASDQRSQTSNQSTATVQHNPDRKVSASSTTSLGSRAAGPLRVVNQNVVSSGNASHTSLSRIESGGSLRPKLHLEIPRDQADWEIENVSRTRPGVESSLLANDGTFEGVDFTNARNALPETQGQLEQDTLSSDVESSDPQAIEYNPFSRAQQDLSARPAIVISRTGPNPYKKLMDHLRKSPLKNKLNPDVRTDRWSLEDSDEDAATNLQIPKPDHAVGHRKTSSWSSNGFITAVKSATPKLAQETPSQRSEKGSRMRLFRRINRNSRSSDATQRASVDSGNDATRIVDEAAYTRAVQRRKVIEEIHTSEEGYINDLKVLAHVYLTILGSMPDFPRSMQFEVERNLNEMLLLHEEILIHMKLFQRDASSKSYSLSTKHLRLNSVDSVDTKGIKKSHWGGRRSMESTFFRHFKTRCLTSEPQEAADVARVFGRMLPRFFAYEEYGARYESMLQLVASTSRSIPNWWAFERGIEALMNSLLPKKAIDDGNKKGLTLEDLLIKPIQRVCRYPLLLAELHKNTSATDDPAAEAAIQKVLYRLRETAQEINNATNDPLSRARIQRSWQLQDLLLFPDDAPLSSSTLRSLGHAKLCGVLFMIHQSQEELRGDYMLCALFDAHLLLALPEPGNKRFKVMAIVGTMDFQIERTDDSRGLQCHHALHTFKLIFSFEQQLHEVILCACSAREEEQWKAELLRSSKADKTIPAASDFTFLALKMRSLGVVFGQPGSLSGRMTIQRATTVDKPKTGCQVTVRNTHSVREGQDSPKALSGSFNRSTSLLSMSRIPVFAPERADRIRLEHALEGVWTKERLPYPGMTTHRVGNFVRVSKESVMRKLSKASTHTQSSKHSVSCSGLDDPFVEAASPKETEQAPPEAAAGQKEITPTSTVRSKLEGYPLRSDVHEAEEPARAAAPDPTKITFDISKPSRSLVASEASVIAGDGASKENRDSDETERPKRGKTLLKAFSAEGIRTWFA